MLTDPKNPITSLLRSRKFLLLAYALVQTLVMHYFSIEQDIIVLVDGLVGLLIAAIAYEDGKRHEAGATQPMMMQADQIQVEQSPATITESRPGPQD